MTTEIDVERLAVAIEAWWKPIEEHVSGPGTYRLSLNPQIVAAEIAAQYEATPSSEKSMGEPPGEPR